MSATRLLRRAVLVASLGALALASGTTLHYIAHPPGSSLREPGVPERVIAYRVTGDEGPRFRIDGQRVLRLESYPVWPTAAYDPAREVVYGLDVTIRAFGREIWRQQVFSRSRQTKLGVGAAITAEAVRAVDGSVELGDGRIVTLALPTVPWGSELSVRASGGAPEVLVRLFARRERDEGGLARAALTLDPIETAERAASLTYSPWALEDVDDRLRLLRFWHERLSAIGERDVDYRIRHIVVRRLPVPERPAGSARGFAVAPGEDAVLNLRGPARLGLEVTARDPGGAPTLRLDAVSEGEPMAPLVIEATAGRRHPVELPPGIHSVRVTADRAAQIVARGPLAAAIRPGRAVDDGDEAVLLPDRVRLPVARTAAGGLPLVIELDAVERGGLTGRVVRLDSRAISPRPDEAARCEVRLVFRAADGRVVARRGHRVEAATTGLETIADDPPRHVTEPVSSRLLAPPRAVRLEVTSDDACAHRLFRFRPGTVELESPYREQPLKLLRYRYPRLARHVWFALEPGNREALRAAGQLHELVAQVRLEPPGDDAATSGPTTLAASALVPEGAPEQQRLREPVAVARRAEVARAWPPGSLTPLRGATELDFSAATPGAPRLYFQAPPAAVGQEVALSLDGAPWLRAELPARGGYLRLETPTAGRHAVAATAPPGVALWIDRRPTRPGAAIERLRTVYALADRPLRVRVAQRRGERLVVNAVVYAARASRATLAIAIDGGAPARRTAEPLGLLTEAVQRVVLPPPRDDGVAVLVDLAGLPAGYARVVPIGLMEDLVAGEHTIELASSAEAPLWVRFFVSRIENRAVESVTQWRSRAGDEVRSAAEVIVAP